MEKDFMDMAFNLRQILCKNFNFHKTSGCASYWQQKNFQMAHYSTLRILWRHWVFKINLECIYVINIFHSNAQATVYIWRNISCVNLTLLWLCCFTTYYIHSKFVTCMIITISFFNFHFFFHGQRTSSS